LFNLRSFLTSFGELFLLGSLGGYHLEESFGKVVIDFHLSSQILDNIILVLVLELVHFGSQILQDILRLLPDLVVILDFFLLEVHIFIMVFRLHLSC